jgi:ParB-like chromosome segregation protein Spo0J
VKIDRIPVSVIEANEDNPRADLRATDPEYLAIQRSVERWDLVEPLVWNERTGRLVSGHQRLKVLKDRGDIEVDVSVVDLDEHEEQALGIALNKITGRWDDPKLLEMLAKLDASGLDVTLTGFHPDDLAQLARDAQPLFEPAEPEPVFTVSTVRQGDINAAEQRQEERFAGQPRKLQSITCPQCGAEFGLGQ